jgi:hypothetical protein
VLKEIKGERKQYCTLKVVDSNNKKPINKDKGDKINLMV